MRFELDWFRSFLCKGTVKTDGVKYPVTFLRDSCTAVAFRNVTGRKVVSCHPVWCRVVSENWRRAGLRYGEDEVFMPASDRRGADGMSRRPACIANQFPSKECTSLTPCSLAGSKVRVRSPFTDADPDVKATDVAVSVVAVIRLKARQAPRLRIPAESVTPGVDCNKAEDYH